VEGSRGIEGLGGVKYRPGLAKVHVSLRLDPFVVAVLDAIADEASSELRDPTRNAVVEALLYVALGGSLPAEAFVKHTFAYRAEDLIASVERAKFRLLEGSKSEKDTE